MTIIQHFCDRCRVQIYEKRTNLIAKTGALRHRAGGLDLCGDCAADLAEWLGALAGDKPTPMFDEMPTLPPPPGDPSWVPTTKAG